MTAAEERAHRLAEGFIVFIETGTPPDGLFAPDVFCDFTMPLWRLQARGVEDVVALRKQGHSGPGRVPRWRFDPTPTGFVLEFEEDWFDEDGEGGGRRWTAREMARADIGEEGISQFSVYCTGDWDEERRLAHADAVTLIRP